MRFLPSSKSEVLRWTLAFLVAFCLFEIVFDIRQAMAGHTGLALLAIFFWAPLAVGLWLLNPVARGVAIFCLWFIVVVVPLGVINPFAVIDNAFGPELPPVWKILVFWIAPYVLPALVAIYVLDKHKSEFRWRDEPAA